MKGSLPGRELLTRISACYKLLQIEVFQKKNLVRISIRYVKIGKNNELFVMNITEFFKFLYLQTFKDRKRPVLLKLLCN